MNTVQVKLRFANELMQWEDRKVYAEFDVIPGNGGLWVDRENHSVTLSQTVSIISKTAGAIESRWNFKGLDQGHYSFS